MLDMSPPSMSKRVPRSRSFTSCAPCRSRHISCDKTRPFCNNCSRNALQCSYAGPLLWLSDSSDGRVSHSERETATTYRFRYALFTDDEREQMADQTNASFAGRTADQLLMLIDDYENNERENPKEQSIVAGPFSAFRLCGLPSIPRAAESNIRDNLETPTQHSEDVANHGYQEEIQNVFEDHNRACDMEPNMLNFEGGAEMPDLMDMVAMALPQLASNHHDFPPSASGSIFIFEDTVGPERTFIDYMPPSEQFIPRSPALNMNMPWPEDVAFLFRYYEANVITPPSSFFKSRKSPWRIILLPGAIQTFTGLAIWNQVSETRMAMFYALLAISAFHLNRTKPNDVLQHWRKQGLEAQRLAKRHLQYALRSETQGSQRAKYKDLLMAVLAMAMSSALDDAQNIRNFLLDAERLIRVRGIPKPHKSQKVLLLHHTYTHLRIMVESICSIEYPDNPRYTLSQNPPATNISFLREFGLAEDSLNLGLDPSSPKNDDEGYTDIHLETQGNWQKTMYPSVYAVPESLITLLSQTLCLANAKPQLDRMALDNPKTAAALANHIFKLERSICHWTPSPRTSSPHSTSIPESEGVAGSANEEMNREEIRSMTLALHQAICIYFYRRIHKVYPMILQTTVAKTLEYLEPCMKGGSEERDFGTSLSWSCFIAACEAMTPELQEKSLEYLSRFDQKGSFWAPWQAVETVKEIWRRREEQEHSYTNWQDLLGVVSPR